MTGKKCTWQRWRIGLLCEHASRLRAGQRFVTRLGHPIAVRILRPAVPERWLRRIHDPQPVSAAPHRSAATLVVSVVRDQQLAVARKRETKGIAETPRHQLGLS